MEQPAQHSRDAGNNRQHKGRSTTSSINDQSTAKPAAAPSYSDCKWLKVGASLRLMHRQVKIFLAAARQSNVDSGTANHQRQQPKKTPHDDKAPAAVRASGCWGGWLTNLSRIRPCLAPSQPVPLVAA
jgi:hypothetical protein